MGRFWYCFKHWAVKKKIVGLHKSNELIVLIWDLCIKEPEQTSVWISAKPVSFWCQCLCRSPFPMAWAAFSTPARKLPAKPAPPSLCVQLASTSASVHVFPPLLTALEMSCKSLMILNVTDSDWGGVYGVNKAKWFLKPTLKVL